MQSQQIPKQQFEFEFPVENNSSKLSDKLQYSPLKPTQISETESYLISRPIVQQIIQKKAQTIKHQINRINTDSQLYAKPQKYDASEYRFNQIPPQNHRYASSCSQKIQQINKGLQNSQKKLNSTASSFDKQPRIKVSGLASCKFTSVKAQRSLGFNQIDHQSRMKQDIRSSQIKILCPKRRQSRILRQNKGKKQQILRRERVIRQNRDIRTSDFLRQYVQQERKEKVIYGEKSKKLHYIKEYMNLQNTDYDEGKHIINQIQKFQGTKYEQKNKKSYTQINEDAIMMNRKIPIISKKIKIRHLSFID